MKQYLLAIIMSSFAINCIAQNDTLTLINHYPQPIVIHTLFESASIATDIPAAITLYPYAQYTITIDPNNLINKEIYMNASAADYFHDDFLGVGLLALKSTTSYEPTSLQVHGYQVTSALSFSWTNPDTAVSVTFCAPKDFNTETYQCN
ncbi:MAG: hypothetical protein A3E87_04500 [Gammaproteobacteria bacterium RIFCSPHIGHO2_12_FULL_35_23]|nr:MAG: hypothetical protein A3E87_04500 [Gammaproteobacteria bacterium RIFCSPHIGHO2_12_FULL_35_23]